MANISYAAPPTVGRFMASQTFARFIVGPVGSGKTTGCIMEILRRAIEQSPGPDGVRHTRFAIVRQTLQQLKMTVLLDILTWLRPIAEYKVSEQLIILRFGDVRSELYMIPLEDEDDQKRLLSMQLTGAFLSECIEMDPNLVSAIAGRCGRYPSAADGGCTWFGLFGDTNAPTLGSPWHALFEEDRPPDWQIYHQPGGLDPNAENLEWLMQTPATLALSPADPVRRLQGRTYYERLARGHNTDWIKRYVHAQYGADPSGSAVWASSFRITYHVARHPDTKLLEPLEPVKGMPLLIGQDFGRDPCSLIAQVNHSGQLVILEEVVAEDTGLQTHVLHSLKPKLWTPRYFGLMMAAVGDPAGKSMNNHYEEDSFDLLNRLGIPAFPAPTNDPDRRIPAVEALLLEQRDGKPALLIDGTRCPKLVQAMNQYYRFGKTLQGTKKTRPDKQHPWSDLADALQYICLALNSGLAHHIQRKIMPRARQRPQAPVSPAGWT